MPDNPESITARRRAGYYAAIAGNTNLHSRLALTNAQGFTPVSYASAA